MKISTIVGSSLVRTYLFRCYEQVKYIDLIHRSYRVTKLFVSWRSDRRSQVIQGVSLGFLQRVACKVAIKCFTIAGDKGKRLSSKSRPSRSRWITGTRWSTRTGWTAGTGWYTWTQGGSGTTRASGNQRRAWDPKEMETVFLEPHQF